MDFKLELILEIKLPYDVNNFVPSDKEFFDKIFTDRFLTPKVSTFTSNLKKVQR